MVPTFQRQFKKCTPLLKLDLQQHTKHSTKAPEKKEIDFWYTLENKKH